VFLNLSLPVNGENCRVVFSFLPAPSSGYHHHVFDYRLWDLVPFLPSLFPKITFLISYHISEMTNDIGRRVFSTTPFPALCLVQFFESILQILLSLTEGPSFCYRVQRFPFYRAFKLMIAPCWFYPTPEHRHEMGGQRRTYGSLPSSSHFHWDSFKAVSFFMPSPVICILFLRIPLNWRKAQRSTV